MNQVQIIGRLVKDPECRVTTTGKAITSFTLAVTREFKNAEGKYEADFIPCVAFDKTGEFVGNYFNKGQRMACVGRIQIDAVTSDDGQKRWFTKVVVNKAEFIEKKADTSAGNGGGFGAPQPDDSGFGG